MAKHWTEEEIDYVRQHYPKENTKDVADYLGKSIPAVQAICRKHGIHKENHFYTAEDIEWLRKNYKIKKIDKCCKKFGLTRTALAQVCKRYGIQCGRFLTNQQRAFIDNNSHKSNQHLSKVLKRSDAAIKSYRTRYGETIIDANYEKLHVAEIERLTGINHKTIYDSWIKRHGLQSEKIGSYRFITRKNLIKFMKDNPKLWNATKCEEWFFNDFDWFNKKHEEDFKKLEKKRWGQFYEVS